MDSFSSFKLANMFAWQDIRDAYRRTALGPWWIAVSLAVQVATIGAIFAIVLDIDIREFLPYLALSLVLWNFISQTLSESANAFFYSERIIKQISLPASFSIFRSLIKNFLYFLHNVPVVGLVFLATDSFRADELVIAGVGMLLVVANAGWISALIAVAGAKYRDIFPITNAILMVFFYATPVIWTLDAVKSDLLTNVMAWNPFFHLLNVVREPLLMGETSWLSLLLAVSGAITGGFVALFTLRAVGWKVVYWL